MSVRDDYALTEIVTVMVDKKTAQHLLDAAQAHIEGDHSETYHQIYEIAVAHSDDPFDPWKDIKEIAASDEDSHK